MDMSQQHNQLLQNMIAASQEQLREMGEEALADGREVINPEAFIRGALEHDRKRKVAGKSRQSKAQKQARRKNRK